MTTRGGSDRVEVFRGDDGLWYWHRVAPNNEIMADSEGYQNRADAMKTATSLFPDVGLWVRDDQVWKEAGVIDESELPQKTDAIEDEELLDPQPEPEQPEGAEEDGPDPAIGPAEDGPEEEA